MPYLPLPPLADGIPLDGGPLPVSSATDVAGEWAVEIQEVTDPIRDAIELGQTAMFLAYQRDSRYAAAQSDPTRSTDEYLDEILEENGCPRKTGQSDGSARDIMFSTPPVISPDAILQVANAILAPYTDILCRYAEQSDGWFVSDGTSTWSSHVFQDASTFMHATPNYPDRPITLNRRPPGSMPNFDTFGKWFLMRVPDISSLDNEIASVFNGSQSEPNSGLETATSVGGFFCGSGSSTADKNITFLFGFASSTVDDVYNSIIASVSSAVGFGIRWDLVVDPLLGP